MHPLKRVAYFLAMVLSIGTLAALSPQATGQTPCASGVTLFEGGRLITGDGSAPIENSAFLVENNRFARICC